MKNIEGIVLTPLVFLTSITQVPRMVSKSASIKVSAGYCPCSMYPRLGIKLLPIKQSDPRVRGDFIKERERGSWHALAGTGLALTAYGTGTNGKQSSCS
jgi:hypothetical protein